MLTRFVIGLIIVTSMYRDRRGKEETVPRELYNGEYEEVINMGEHINKSGKVVIA